VVQLVTLADAVIAVLPAAVVFFAAFGRYDETFRDNVVFLYFMGGLLVGGFLGFLTLLVDNGLAPLFAVIGVALVVPIGLVAAINRRKWQGERHSVFNGGALGLGAAVMMALSFLYFQSVTYRRQGCLALALDCSTTLQDAQQAALDAFVRGRAFTLPTLAQDLLLALAITGVLLALGLLAGDAVRQRRQFRGALLGTAIFLAPAIFLNELAHAWQSGTGGEWLWSLLLAAYGATVGLLAERRLLIEGVPDEARRERRRERRAARR
jgi:hypothetical protein